MNFAEHLFVPSALLDLVNILQVGLDLRNATGVKNMLAKFPQPDRVRYINDRIDAEALKRRKTEEQNWYYGFLENLMEICNK